jgi:Lipocalin-like domain
MSCPDVKALIRPQLVGTWVLQAYLEEPVDGRPGIRPFGERPGGFLIYTEDGYVSAQLMKQDRPAFKSTKWLDGTPEEYRAAASSYIAYSGTYEVNDKEATVTHIPDVALIPNWIGGRQKRWITLEEGRLTLRTAETVGTDGSLVVARLEWLRASKQPLAS